MCFTKYSTIFLPTDLEILQKVFDQLCRERRLALKDRDQRQHSWALSRTASLMKLNCRGRFRSAAQPWREALKPAPTYSL